MLAQCASEVLMVRPVAFRFNPETASTNSFQKSIADPEVTNKALAEYDLAVNRLRQNRIRVVSLDVENGATPDAVFPNNWITFHHDGTAVLYPMMADNRRQERSEKIMTEIRKNIYITSVIDLTGYEKENKFLEGTGSVVYDHHHKIAYACISPRTDVSVLNELCDRTGYKKFIFNASDNGSAIYHTNVVLHIGKTYAVVCLEALSDSKERNDLRRMLAFTGHEIITISKEQMRCFAGNMLQVCNDKGKYFTLISSTAIRTLHLPQINAICESSELLSFDVHNIEMAGGGSIRCMISEIFSSPVTVK